jgi:hypothetical protein
LSEDKYVLGILQDENGVPVCDYRGDIVRVMAPYDSGYTTYENWHGTEAWAAVIAHYREMQRQTDLNEFVSKITGEEYGDYKNQTD